MIGNKNYFVTHRKILIKGSFIQAFSSTISKIRCNIYHTEY